MKKMFFRMLILLIALVPIVISPQKTSAQIIKIGTVLDVAVNGNNAYLKTTNGLVVADVSDPTHPRGVGSLGFTIGGLAYSQNLLVVTRLLDGVPGMSVVDVTNPATPAVVGSLAMETGPVVVQGSYAYFLDLSPPYHLRIVDFSVPTNPVLTAELTLTGTPSNIAVTGNFVYVAGDTFRVIDVSIPTSPRVTASVPVMSRRVAAKPGYAIIDWPDNTFGGMQVMDVNNPAAPVVIGQHETYCFFNGLALGGNLVFGAFRDTMNINRGLRIMDITTPSAPVTRGAMYTPGGAFSVAAYGSYAYVADGTAGLQIIDVSNPASPRIVGNLKDVDAVQLTKSVDKASASPGETLTYTTTYTNTATARTNARIEDLIPSGTTYVSGSATTGGVFDGTKVIWNLGSLAGGATGTVSFKVRLFQ